MHAVAKTDFGQRRLRSQDGFGRWHAGEFQRHRNVVDGGQVVEQVEVLEDPTHEFSAHIHDAGGALEPVGSLAQCDAAVIPSE